MFKLAKFIRGKALIFTIIGVICVMGAAYFDASQPTFLNDAITSLSNGVWWGKDASGIYEQLNWATYHQIFDISTMSPMDGPALYAFWPAIIMMAIYATCSLSVGLAGSFLGSAAALYAAMNTRNGMFGKIQTYSFCEVDKLSTASLITRLSNDVQKHQINLQMILTMLFRAPVTIVISLISAFTPPMGNTTYGCITIGIVVVMLLVVGIIGSRVIPIFSKAQKKLDGTNAIMRENILGARVVKAFNIQNNQHERYETENKELKRLNIRGQALMLPIMSIITFILNAGIVIILIVAGAQFVHSDSHPSINAGIFAFTQLIIIVLFSAMIAVMVIVNSTRTMASIKRINEVLDTNSSIVDSKTPVTIPNNYSLKFEHVNFKYSTTSESNVLDDVNFEVESGTTLGIIGGTGSGKSTIASLIPRFYDVTSGSITIGGVNIKDASTNQLNGIVGVVLQESVLFAGTIASNLKFGKQDATKEEMIEACTNACAWDFIEAMPLQLESEVEQRGRNYSGGQKQRISLARTLIKKPNILVLDDTTSALDLITESRVQENLQSNFKNTTTLIISQRISSVKHADKILVLENGKIIAQGSHQELVKVSDVYRQIVDSQLGKEGME